MKFFADTADTAEIRDLAETGPSTIPAISCTTSRKSRPALWISDGLVVTPSSRPVSARSRISAVSAVSTKNFMASGPRALRLTGCA